MNNELIDFSQLMRIDDIYIPFEIYSIQKKNCKKMKLQTKIPFVIVSTDYCKEFSENYFIISISDNPKIIEEENINLQDKDINKLKTLIIKNKEMLLNYWNGNNEKIKIVNNEWVDLTYNDEIGFYICGIPYNDSDIKLFVVETECLDVFDGDLANPFILSMDKNYILKKVYFNDIKETEINKYIRKNKKILLKHWNNEISDIEMLENLNLK